MVIRGGGIVTMATSLVRRVEEGGLSSCLGGQHRNSSGVLRRREGWQQWDDEGRHNVGIGAVREV
jgi:hypothetical protein